MSVVDTAEPFVGRTPELTDLRAGIDSLFGGRGRLYLLVGEAGIGKTRLADQIAAEAQARGARVLWGRCWESGGAPSYWPWSQLIRSYVADRMAAAPAALEVLPALAALSELRGDAAHSANAPEQARFQLFDATTRFLQAAAAQQPLVLILDDLHAADHASLLLLRFVSRELRSARWLIIGTYRDAEASRNSANASLLAEIAREGQRLPLRGLSLAETSEYISSTSGAPNAPLVDAVYTVTEGNPFFLTEVVRLWERATGAGQRSDATTLKLAIPDEVREAIRQRLSALSPEALRLLTTAAVIGREFELPLLAHLSASIADEHQCLRLLDEALALHVVSRCDGMPHRFSFSHLLIRDTLYDDLGSSARGDLHRRIGEAMEALYANQQTHYLAEMAHHFAHASAAGSIDKAVQYSRLAGDRALALLAYEEAAGRYQHALDCLDLRRFAVRSSDAELRCQLLLMLGDAQWGGGDLAAMRTTFQQAAEIAAHLPCEQSGPLLARAALGLGGRQQRAHVALDETVVRLLERALESLADEDSVLRARCLARLGYALYSQPESYPRRVALTQAAVQMARRLGDRETIGWVLNDWRWALWGPDNLDDRLRIAAELVAIAQQQDNREMLLTEHAWRLVDFLELGDVAAVDAELRIFTRLAHEIRLPWFRWYVSRFSALKATLEGRFGEAEAFAEEALQTAQRVQHQDAFLIYATQVMTLRLEQGRLQELEAGLQGLVAQYSAVPIWRYLLAYLHAQQGREAETRREFDRIAESGFGALPNDYLRLTNAAYLAEVASFLRDRKAAAELYELIVPYAQRCVVIGFGLACLGSLARHLGLLATTIERWPEAEAHFEAALRVNERLRAQPALARTRFGYAEMLLRSPQCNDELRRRAQSLARQAYAGAHDIGMQALSDRIASWAEQNSLELCEPAAAEQPPAAVLPPSSSARSTARLRRDDAHWVVSFGGESFRFKDLRGLAYIAHLLKHPGQEFHASQLVALVEGEETSGEAEQLRARLNAVQEGLANAEAMNDIGRAQQLRGELERLAEQFAAGAGIGGSDPKAGERARVRVTKRISIALRRIGEHTPTLARYLENNVKTGSYCSFTPDPTQAVDWDL